MAKKPVDKEIKDFVDKLNRTIKDSSVPPRISKAISMFKKQRNLLYLDKNGAELKAVIKSQTNNDLDYAISIKSDGNFFCGTQNLRPCGGLRGKICKHIILGLIAAIKSGEADINSMIEWVQKTSSNKPSLLRDEAMEIFVKYKCALDGEIEWRPIELLPEDFIAF
ncbi:MAG: hypothetical protein JW891_09575 [Candidatus Lokiarchaeota archaeon]|nr:hypothetical protein [Candidatus Lokiarchaeota archaeon]